MSEGGKEERGREGGREGGRKGGEREGGREGGREGMREEGGREKESEGGRKGRKGGRVEMQTERKIAKDTLSTCRVGNLHEEIENHNSLGCELPLGLVTHCAGRISANARPHQLCWGDRECGYYTSCM